MGKLKNHYLQNEDQSLAAIKLGELTDLSAQIEAWCNRCGHYRMMAPEHLINRLGPLISVPEIGVHMECESCNSKDLAARPVWLEPMPLMMMAAE
ncbi:MAG: hypothetical protein HQ483_08785 [Rhodospirillales bacterium]|nr:hypothetical protein [Rhodospirillales bacterium]